MKAMILTASASLLLLSACGKNADETAGESGAPLSTDEIAKTVDSVKLTPGQWETTVEILDVKMEGLPAGTPAGAMDRMIGTKTTVSNCITPEQAKKPSADFLSAQKDTNCSYSTFDMSGGMIKAAMNCRVTDTPGEMRVSMTGKYGSDSYDMSQDTNVSGLPGGMSMAMKSKVSGRNVGECATDQGDAG